MWMPFAAFGFRRPNRQNMELAEPTMYRYPDGTQPLHHVRQLLSNWRAALDPFDRMLALPGVLNFIQRTT